MSQIIIKTNKYMNKIKNSYGVLNNEVEKFGNNDSTPYHTHLQKTLKEMREKINELEGIILTLILLLKMLLLILMSLLIIILK